MPRKVLLLFSCALVFWCCGCFFDDATTDAGTEDAKREAWYNSSLRGSIFGSVSEEEISDALPKALPSAGPSSDRGMIHELHERGRYLSQAAACGSCHGAKPADPASPLTGGRLMEDRFGSVYAPNLTPVSPGLGDWTIKEIGSAIRASLGKGGGPLSLDAHAQFRWMADSDAIALAVYLKSLKKERHDVERRELGRFERKSMGLVTRHQAIFGFVPQPGTNSPIESGRYLVKAVTGCGNCHTPDPSTFSTAEPLSGRDETDDPAEYPQGGPDIRGKSGALKAWRNSDIVSYLDSGVKPDGRKSNGNLCPWPFFQSLTKRDKQSIAEYIKTQ